MERLEKLEDSIYLDQEKNYERIAQYGYLANIYMSVLDSPYYMERLWHVIEGMRIHPDPLIRVILLMQLPKLALVAEPEDRTSCTQWRFILENLIDGDDKIRKSSQMVLLFFMKKLLLDQDVLEEYMYPAVERACSIYLDSVDLMCQMAPLAGKEATERHFLRRFIALASEADSFIRENCVRNFSCMCFAVGTETCDAKLLPVFIKLCCDSEVLVRSACVDVFVTVACHFTMEKRRNELTLAFSELLLDESSTVRLSAYRTLGAFMCTFAEHSVAELLANDRFVDEFGTGSHGVGSTSSHLQLLKTEKPCDVFSKAYIKELFPSFSGAASHGDVLRSWNGGYGGRNRRDSPFGIFFPIFIDYGQLGDPETEKVVTHSESRHSLLEGFATEIKDEEEDEDEDEDKDKDKDEDKDEDEEEEQCNSKDSEELEEFNSFRYWQIPPMDVDPLLSEAEKETFESEKIWGHSKEEEEEEEEEDEEDGMGGIAQCNPEILELHRSVLLSATSPESDWNNTQELIDTVHRCMSLILAPEARTESPTPCDSAESQVERAPTPSQDVVPQILLDHFISMGNQPPHVKKKVLADQEKAQSCATWFPAVALTLGPSNWPCLKDTHKCLSTNFHWKVRKTMASSIHELASMLGEEVAAKDLIPAFRSFIMDTDDVVIGALEHLSDLFKSLVPEKRKYVLFDLWGIVDGDWMQNWRFNEELAVQLRSSINLFTPSECFEDFVPMAETLLCDKAASVRLKAVELMSDLIVYMKEDANFLSSLVNRLLNEFASHSSWRRRQIYALLCSHLAQGKLLDPDVFSTYFLDTLLKMREDSVPNVVIGVARCLSVNIIRNRYISTNSPHFEEIMHVLKELEGNKDVDVRYFASLHVDVDDNSEGFSS